MRVGVLGSPTSWYLADLQRAGASDFAVEPVDFSRLKSRVSNASVEMSAGDFECQRGETLLVRTMPLGSLEQIIFRMNALHLLSRQGVRIVNEPRSLEIAIDKYLTTGMLAQAEIPTPPTLVCQKLSDANDAFEQLGGDVVIKPMFGGEGRGICRVTDREVLHRVIQALLQFNSVIYMQPFVDHEGFDIRLLFIGDDYFAMRRSCRGDWRTNVSQGAHAEAMQPSVEQIELARAAARITKAELVAVDILPARSGEDFVLEVNAVPGWKALAQVTGVDIARVILEYLQREPASSG